MSDPTPEMPLPGDTPMDTAITGKIFTVGTLRYTKAAIFVLFFFLMWNDLILMLMEQVQGLLPVIMKNNGLSNTEMSVLGTVLGPLTMWINPVVSTWSDRTRTRYGRRRPFLALATPPCAIFLALIPWAPDFFHAAQGVSWIHHLFLAHETLGFCVFLGVILLGFNAFNSTLLAIFSYYYWDVVPEPVLSRFYAMGKVISTLATVIWNYFLLQYAGHYMKELFAGVAVVFGVIYLVTVWQVKEGDYPPAPPRSAANPIVNFIQAVGGYFTDCFSQRRYLLVFGTLMLYQLGNAAGGFLILFYHSQMHLKFKTIGHILAIPPMVVAVVAYPIGSLLDRVGAVRSVPVAMALWALSNLGAFFFLHNEATMLIFLIAINLFIAAFGIAIGVLTVEVYPKVKLGQFCSASALAQSVFCMILGPLAGFMLDKVHNYQYCFLWPAVIQGTSAIGFYLIYRAWKKGVYKDLPAATVLPESIAPGATP